VIKKRHPRVEKQPIVVICLKKRSIFVDQGDDTVGSRHRFESLPVRSFSDFSSWQQTFPTQCSFLSNNLH
jgi:hypothetical protein